MLEAVVDSGTAKAARIPGLTIAGKTGTAQKYDAAQHTYGRGLYVSSFAGFAPAEAPQIVGVVVIDEPHGRRYYGGEVAAPVFRQVMLDLRSLPSGSFVTPASPVVTPPPAPGPVTVPDLRLLPPRAADRTLADAGLHGRFQGEGERVLAQFPAAGAAVERGSRVEPGSPRRPIPRAPRCPSWSGSRCATRCASCRAGKWRARCRDMAR
jgi:stage V sporulation protein D (sporulation-specific penicillin-binding protein)